MPQLSANTSEWVGVVAHIELKFNGIGCSPGYWRVEPHRSSWDGVDPDYTSEVQYTDTFKSWFGSIPDLFAEDDSLLDVLWTGGGDEIALARHAAAHLANADAAANGYIPGYFFTIQNVIDLYNQGMQGDAEAVTAIFEAAQETCPLDSVDSSQLSGFSSQDSTLDSMAADARQPAPPRRSLARSNTTPTTATFESTATPKAPPRSTNSPRRAATPSPTASTPSTVTSLAAASSTPEPTIMPAPATATPSPTALIDSTATAKAVASSTPELTATPAPATATPSATASRSAGSTPTPAPTQAVSTAVVATVTTVEPQDDGSLSAFEIWAGLGPLPPIPEACAQIKFDKVFLMWEPGGYVSADGNDLIFGTNGDDTIDSGGGDDCIVAGDGVDDVTAGGGSDVVFGGHGDDRLRGVDGNDSLFGEPGADRIWGGAGDDKIDGGADSDLCTGDDGKNEIVNCEPLPAPNGLTGTYSEKNKTVDLVWNAKPNAESYSVFVSRDGTTWSLLGNAGGTKYSHSVKAGDVYYYSVSYTDKDGFKSARSSAFRIKAGTATATPIATATGIPTATSTVQLGIIPATVSATPIATATPQATGSSTPGPTATSEPGTATPQPTTEPTASPTQTSTPPPEPTPEPTNTPGPSTTPEPTITP